MGSPSKKMEPYGAYILLGLLEGFKNKFSSWWTSISAWGSETMKKFGSWAGKIWDAMKKVFTGIPEWFKTKFSNAWTNIKTAFAPFTNFFGTLWDGIKDGFSKALWALKDVAKGPINAVITVLNTLISAMNSLSFDVPDWPIYPKEIRGKSIGFNLKRIPMLATGTVIPPNSEFLALLGDQKKGVNIEAPLDTIVEAFKKVNGENAGGSGGTIIVQCILDGEVVYKNVIKHNKYNTRRTGKNLLTE
jgi:hypothetical protein